MTLFVYTLFILWPIGMFLSLISTHFAGVVFRPEYKHLLLGYSFKQRPFGLYLGEMKQAIKLATDDYSRKQLQKAIRYRLYMRYVISTSVGSLVILWIFG